MSGFGQGPIFEQDTETDPFKPGRDHVGALLRLQKESADQYQRLFDFFADEHGLILTEGEMDDIIHEVNEHEKRMKESA